jgi:aerobic-type carbon monoxide dehydrogenase small subunit (CoxS/CutS family)
MARYLLTVNGAPRSVEASPDTPLLWVLRDTLGLTGTKYGCGEGQCGACTVHETGQAIRSCQTTIADAAGRSYLTIEGLSNDGSHPVQRAWIEEDVAQCGYCQAGMIMETVALLRATPRPNDKEVDEALASHICRCGVYNRLRAAVKRAAEMTPLSSKS